MTPKQCRVKSRMTEQQIADLIGITLKDYLYYERNPEKMPLFIARLFSNVVRVSIDDIFFIANSN